MDHCVHLHNNGVFNSSFKGGEGVVVSVVAMVVVVHTVILMALT